MQVSGGEGCWGVDGSGEVACGLVWVGRGVQVLSWERGRARLEHGTISMMQVRKGRRGSGAGKAVMGLAMALGVSGTEQRESLVRWLWHEDLPGFRMVPQ